MKNNFYQFNKVLLALPVLAILFFGFTPSAYAIPCSQCADETDIAACYATCTSSSGTTDTTGGSSINVSDSVASCKSITDINSVVSCGIGLMQLVIYILISIAMVYTLYSAFKFIGSDGDGKNEWRDKMIRGLIALVVMVSVWGIINIFTNTFGFSDNAQITVPNFGTPTQ